MSEMKLSSVCQAAHTKIRIVQSRRGGAGKGGGGGALPRHVQSNDELLHLPCIHMMSVIDKPMPLCCLLLSIQSAVMGRVPLKDSADAHRSEHV